MYCGNTVTKRKMKINALFSPPESTDFVSESGWITVGSWLLQGVKTEPLGLEARLWVSSSELVSVKRLLRATIRSVVFHGGIGCFRGSSSSELVVSDAGS